MDVIDAGTFFPAGCTPDGACWTDYVSERPCIVRQFDDLPKHWQKGLTLSSTSMCQVWVKRNPQAGEGWTNPSNRWTVEKIVAHEVGHDNCVTRHFNGIVDCWKDRQK